jgi:hypothetical protein
MVPERGEEGFLFSLSLFFLSQVEAFFFPVKIFLYSTFSLSVSLSLSLSLSFSLSLFEIRLSTTKAGLRLQIRRRRGDGGEEEMRLIRIGEEERGHERNK